MSSVWKLWSAWVYPVTVISSRTRRRPVASRSQYRTKSIASAVSERMNAWLRLALALRAKSDRRFSASYADFAWMVESVPPCPVFIAWSKS